MENWPAMNFASGKHSMMISIAVKKKGLFLHSDTEPAWKRDVGRHSDTFPLGEIDEWADLGNSASHIWRHARNQGRGLQAIVSVKAYVCWERDQSPGV